MRVRHSFEGGRAIKICPTDKAEYADELSFCPLCGTRLMAVGLRKGEVIGGSYRIVDLIGRGWAGAAYRAEHSMMGRPTALKVITSPLVADPAFIERFRHAAHLLSELDAPQAAMVHDLGLEPPNKIYIASEFVDGKSLAKVLAEEGPMAPDRFLGLMRTILEGLETAHQMGLVHGSLKPSNVIVAADGSGPKIMDFGAGRIVASLQDETFASRTSYGLLYGDIAYMSPEQITGEEVNAQSDIYSLGLVMYELLTGAKPFRQDSPDGLAKAQVEEKPVPPREFKPQLKTPKFIEKAVMQALEKKARKRQESALEMLEELQAEIVPEEVEPRSVWQRAKAPVAPKAAADQAPEPPLPPLPGGTQPIQKLRPPAPPSAPVARPVSPAGKTQAVAPPKAESLEEMKGPRLILYDGKHIMAVYPIDKPEMLVGRSPECDIAIDDRTVSRVHARIVSKPEKIVVEDLTSLNGTYINNDAVSRGHIEDKDDVAFGNVSLVFRTT